MSDKAQFIVSGNSAIFNPSSVVTVEGAIKVVQGGKVVASIDAKYDFSEIPEAYHGLVFSLIERGKTVHVAL